jgi:hypothetical protein
LAKGRQTIAGTVAFMRLKHGSRHGMPRRAAPN